VRASLTPTRRPSDERGQEKNKNKKRKKDRKKTGMVSFPRAGRYVLILKPVHR